MVVTGDNVDHFKPSGDGVGKIVAAIGTASGHEDSHDWRCGCNMAESGGAPSLAVVWDSITKANLYIELHVWLEQVLLQWDK